MRGALNTSPIACVSPICQVGARVTRVGLAWVVCCSASAETVLTEADAAAIPPAVSMQGVAARKRLAITIKLVQSKNQGHVVRCVSK